MYVTMSAMAVVQFGLAMSFDLDRRAT